jgi:hypothetical protein
MDGCCVCGDKKNAGLKIEAMVFGLSSSRKHVSIHNSNKKM